MEDAESPSGATLVDVWLVDVAYEDTDPVLWAILSPEERERASAYRSAEDRARYLAAHSALRLLLGTRLGCQPAEVKFARLPCPHCGEPHGRPTLAVQPVPALHFSVSHGGNMVMMALAPTPIGVDVEPRPSPKALADVIEALHPQERCDLAGLEGDDQGLAFAELWVRKEAYLKGLGTGLARDLGADYLGPGCPARWPWGWSIANVTATNGHAAAYAVESLTATARVTRRLEVKGILGLGLGLPTPRREQAVTWPTTL